MADITKLLVEKKPELIEEQDIYGRTALHYAASYHSFEVARVLIESDSSEAYIQDKDGRTPLHFAAGKGDEDVTREIIGRYPDTVDLVDKRGQNVSFLHRKEEIQVYGDLRNPGAKISIVESFNEKDWDLVNAQKAAEDKDNIIKEINSNQMIVATVIATVSFAAAFQFPGGYNSNDGTATLAKKAAFQVFVVTDAMALSCSMTAVFLSFMFTLTRDRNDDSKIDESLTIMFFTILILIAVIAMFAALVAGLYAVLTNFLWLAICTCFIVCGIYLLSPFFVNFLFRKLGWAGGFRQLFSGDHLASVD
ncbi:hypothetical protein HHK36_022023 [Tetracentron sinense]|uniref:PGG domain-containing protein n=1 Tax=Tetracentron sinense TaxID=13715 RepID=A0A835D9A7_TETSI|nr:hypothetical protein HHK36_022023 [Tetracentron sinense]